MSKDKKKNDLEQKLKKKQLELERQEAEKNEKLRIRREKDIREQGIRKISLDETTKLTDSWFREFNKEYEDYHRKIERYRYYDCDPLPNVSSVQNIRRYLYKINYYQENDNKDTIDWSLPSDERSILNQDISRVNLCYNVLKADQVDIGDTYNKDIGDILEVIDRINIFVENVEMKGYGLDYDCVELLAMIRVLEDTINELISSFSLRVLRFVEQNMEDQNCHIKNYMYNSNSFKFSLVAFRDVPLPQPSHIIAETRFDSVGCVIYYRDDLLELDGTSFRGIRMFYDHKTRLTSSYQRNLGSFDTSTLSEVMEKEWSLRELMLNKRLEEMKAARQEYDEYIANKLLDDKNKGKKVEEATKGKKKKKKKKKEAVPVEPPIVTPFTLVDISAQYLEYEESEFQNYVAKMKEFVESLNPYELNMRNHLIAVSYSIDHLEKIGQPRKLINNMLLTLMENTKQPKVINGNYKPDFHVIEEPPDLDPKSDEAKHYHDAVEAELSKLIKVEIQLPETVYWWSDPIIVQWEPWEESKEFLELDPRLQFYNLHYNEIMENINNRLIKPASDSPSPLKVSKNKRITDFLVEDPPSSVKLGDIFRDIVIKLMLPDYQFEIERKEDIEKLEAELHRRKVMQQERYEDYLLNKARRDAARDERRQELDRKRQERDEYLAVIEEERQRLMEEAMEQAVEGEDGELVIPQVDLPPLLHPFGSLPSIVSSSDDEANYMIKFKDIADSTLPTPLFPMKDKMSEFIITSMKRLRFVFPEEGGGDAPKTTKYLFSDLTKELADIFKAHEPIFNPLVRQKIQEKVHDVSYSKPQSFKNQSILRKSVKTKKRESKRFTVMNIEAPIEVTEKTVPEKIDLKLIPHADGSWSSEGIHNVHFDNDTHTLIFHTEKLGLYGIALPKYANMPYLKWNLRPEIVNDVACAYFNLKLPTNWYVQIFISPEGYKVSLITPTRKTDTSKNPPTKFIALRELKTFLVSVGINIFPDLDAVCYVDKISEKHHELENHTYRCIAFYCTTHLFIHNVWNHLCDRREIIVDVEQISTSEDDMDFTTTYKITPLDAFSVNITEDCLPPPNYHLTIVNNPPDQDFSADLHSALRSKITVSNIKISEETNSIFRAYVSQLLMAIRPFSFS